MQLNTKTQILISCIILEVVSHDHDLCGFVLVVFCTEA